MQNIMVNYHDNTYNIPVMVIDRNDESVLATIDTTLVIMTVGISASGKTTWATRVANELGAVNINRDDIRFAENGLFHEFNDNRGAYNHDWENEKQVTRVAFNMAKKAIRNHQSMIISDTNLSSKTRKEWFRWAVKNNIHTEYTFVIVICDVDLETTIERDNNRTNDRVGENVIRNQYERYCNTVRNLTS